MLIGIVEVVGPDRALDVCIHSADDDDGAVERCGARWDLHTGTVPSTDRSEHAALNAGLGAVATHGCGTLSSLIGLREATLAQIGRAHV